MKYLDNNKLEILLPDSSASLRIKMEKEMDREKFIEQAHLYLMDELAQKEKIEFENEMMENSEFGKEFESIKQIYNAFTASRPAEADEKLLTSARNSLMRAIRSEIAKPTVKEKVIEWLKNIFVTNYKFALGSFAMMLVGLFIGYFLFSSSDMPMIETSRSVNVDNITDGSTKITNIRFPSPFSEGGEIEIAFDAVKPISYKGTADDPVIQKLLATALVTQSNPGLRLKTVNAISSQIESENFNHDPKTKSSLITAMKVDENPAVRREALNALIKFPFDDEIRDAFLFVLSNDRNSGMRVSAINALAELKVQGKSLDEKIINELNRKAQYDESDFIRIRAASLVKEVY